MSDPTYMYPDAGSVFGDARDTASAREALQRRYEGLRTRRLAGREAEREAQAAEQAAIEDIAKSAGIGLARGAIGLATLPGDFANLARTGLGWAADQTAGRIYNGISRGEWDATTDAREGMERANARNKYTAANLQRAIENDLTGRFYEPRTRAGRYAQTIGQNLPGALLGPGGLARNALIAGVSGAAEEAAGQATEGSVFEPYVRGAVGTVASLAGPRAANLLEDRAARNLVRREAPTVNGFNNAARESYEAADQAGIGFNGSAIGRMTTDIARDLREAGAVPDIQRGAEILRQRAQEVASNAPGYGPLANLRREVDNVTQTGDRANAPLAAQMRNRIDEFATDPGLGGLRTNGTEQADRLAAQAQDYWGAQRRSEIVDRAMRRAEENAAGAGLAAATKKEFEAIRNTPDLARLFSPGDLEAMQNLAQGSPGRQALHWVGRQRPTAAQVATILSAGGLSKLLSDGPAWSNSVLAAGAAAGVNHVAAPRIARLADNMLRADAAHLAARVRSGAGNRSPELATVLATDPAKRQRRDALLGALLLSREAQDLAPAIMP